MRLHGYSGQQPFSAHDGQSGASCPDVNEPAGADRIVKLVTVFGVELGDEARYDSQPSTNDAVLSV